MSLSVNMRLLGNQGPSEEVRTEEAVGPCRIKVAVNELVQRLSPLDAGSSCEDEGEEMLPVSHLVFAAADGCCEAWGTPRAADAIMKGQEEFVSG